MLRRLGALALLATPFIATLSTPSSAQRSFDDDRYNGGYEDRYESDDRSGGREKDVAGTFDYYALVMSWSPTYCSEKEGGDYDQQCDRQDGRRYSFVLHGLWPQYERGYPERCRTRKRPYVPQPLIDGMMDIMPSSKLVIHEYKKHGTCSGLDPAGYFEQSRKLFDKIQIPGRYRNPYEAQFISPDEVEGDFLDENPSLKPEMLAVSCGGAGNRLKEIRICFSKEGEFRSCGPNEDQRRLCNAQKMYLPPVRSSKIEPDSPEDREKARRKDTPRPRVIEGVRR